MSILLSRCSDHQCFFQPTCGPCLSAPNGATGLYLRFHVHAFSPFWFELLPTFFKPTYGPCSVTPDCVACFYSRFHVHAFSPFCFELFPTFLRAGLRPMLSYPKLRCLPLPSF